MARCSSKYTTLGLCLLLLIIIIDIWRYNCPKEGRMENWLGRPHEDSAPGSALYPDTNDPWASKALSQKARQAAVFDTCKLVDASTSDVAAVYKNLLVFDQLKLIYCSIPRTGSADWLTLLQHLNSKGSGGAEVQPLSEYTMDEAEARLQKYFKLIQVRHPIERVVSAFKESPQGQSDDSPTAFESFMVEGLKQPSGLIHSYVAQCQPCRIHYNYISTLETAETDVPNALQAAGLPRAKYNNTEMSEIKLAPSETKDYIITAMHLYRWDVALFAYKQYPEQV